MISTYNRSAMLPEALDGALAQRGVDHEVIVVDNGSTDDTADVLKGYDDRRLRVIRNPESLGGTGGRNTGLAAARGRYVGILDDDDVWHPEKLRKQLSAIQESARAWCFTGCVYIDRERRILGGVPPPSAERVARELPYRFIVPGGMSNVLWRRDALDDGLLDASLFFTVDWDLALRLLSCGPPAVVREPLVAYRQHATNASWEARRYQPELDVLERKHAELRGGLPLDRGAQHRFLASQSLRGGRRWEAAVCYWRAIRTGDWGSAVRAGALLVPRTLQPVARRRFLSERTWIRQAQGWL